MTPSLPELQRRFAAALLDEHAEGGLAVYRNTVFANYRNALGATFRVVRELTGTPFFDAAVDAFVLAHPSNGGDLNVYGDGFADFLAGYPYAKYLPYLPDVARLEWALDEAGRAADSGRSPERLLAALAAVPPAAVVHTRFALDPSCRLLRSTHPVMRIWQAHRDGAFDAIDLKAGPDHLLVRREGSAPVIERLAPADFAFLATLAGGGDLATALEAALAFDADFELGAALPAQIASGVLAELA
jgi:hypothetical protein